MWRLIYFAPAISRETHERIVNLLNAIEERHGIPWEEIVVRSTEWYGKRLMMTEDEVYERYLKPSTNIIKTSSEILRSLGLNINPETVARKFKTRSGYPVIAGTIALAYGELVIWASPYDHEVIQFLEKLYVEGRGLIEKLAPDPTEIMRKLYRASYAEGVKERSILQVVAQDLISRGYDVYVNVRHNMLTNEEPVYMFIPDADIIAIKGSRVVGIEVKGSKGEEPSLDQIYTGLGEALFYLINPIHFVYRGIKLEGGIFDDVYLLLPRIPNGFENLIITMFKDIGIVGLTTLEQGLRVEPKSNPYINKEKKRLFLENIHVIARYRFTE